MSQDILSPSCQRAGAHVRAEQELRLFILGFYARYKNSGECNYENVNVARRFGVPASTLEGWLKRAIKACQKKADEDWAKETEEKSQRFRAPYITSASIVAFCFSAMREGAFLSNDGSYEDIVAAIVSRKKKSDRYYLLTLGKGGKA